MMHPDTELRFISPEVGHGVYATAPIAKGTVVWVLCRFDRVFTPAEVDALPAAYQPLVERYAYVDQFGDYILCWDNARSINHSCDFNMIGVGHDFEVATRDIQAGEQITCEYGGLNLSGRLRCRCGSPKCRGVITGEDALRLWKEWDGIVRDSLDVAVDVPQPLLGFARDPQQFWGWVHGVEPVPSHREFHSGGEASADDVSERPWARPRRVSA